jgi:hypothetical protein
VFYVIKRIELEILLNRDGSQVYFGKTGEPFCKTVKDDRQGLGLVGVGWIFIVGSRSDGRASLGWGSGGGRTPARRRRSAGWRGSPEFAPLSVPVHEKSCGLAEQQELGAGIPPEGLGGLEGERERRSVATYGGGGPAKLGMRGTGRKEGRKGLGSFPGSLGSLGRR